MEFNPSKCQVLHISRARQPIHSQYTLHGEILESVCARYLVVSISKDLSWNTHIRQITSKSNRTLGFVKRNVRTENQHVKELAYKTLVRPQVEYVSTVWSPYTKQNIQKIAEMVQRRAARWVSNSYSYYDSVSAMLSNLGWCFLEYRRYDSRLAMFYKIQYTALLQCLCHRISSVPLGSLAICIPLVSARYMFLMTIIRFHFFPLFCGKGPRRFSSVSRSWLLQDRSEQDQLSRPVESSICLYPVFISCLLTLTLSSFSHCHAFISHYKSFTVILTHPAHNTQSWGWRSI